MHDIERVEFSSALHRRPGFVVAAGVGQDDAEHAMSEGKVRVERDGPAVAASAADQSQPSQKLKLPRAVWTSARLASAVTALAIASRAFCMMRRGGASP
jgi:hypothetical protein